MVRMHRTVHWTATARMQTNTKNYWKEDRNRATLKLTATSHQRRHEERVFAHNDMDFTPRDAGACETSGRLGVRHHLKQRRSLFMAAADSGARAQELQPFRVTGVTL